MSARRIVYICERCFAAEASQKQCCGHAMVECDPGPPGEERSRPLYTADGELRSHAPRWWLERHQPRT